MSAFSHLTSQKDFAFNGNDILVIDIGSGQIAFSTQGNAVFTRTLDFGTKALANEIDPGGNMNVEVFQRKVFERIDSCALTMINQNVDFGTKNKIIFCNGF